MEGAVEQQAPAEALTEPSAAPVTPLLRATFRVALVLVAGIAMLSWLVKAVSFWRDGQGAFDFSLQYNAALALRDNPHANIYDPHILQATAAAHHVFLGVSYARGFDYPPLLPILLVPLTWLPFSVAVDLWLAFNVLLSLAGVTVLIDWLRRALPAGSRDGDRLFIVATLFIALMYQPLVQGVRLGQASVLIFFLIVLAGWLIERGHPELAGAALGVAAWIKVYPLLLIAYYWLRRERRIIHGAALAGAIGLILVLVMMGIPGLLSMGGVLLNGGADTLDAHNEALARVPFWVAVELGGGAGPITTALGYLLVAAVGLVFVAVVLLVWRVALPAAVPDLSRLTDQARNALDAHGYAWGLCTMVLVAPITWEHYDAWLLPAFALVLGYAVRARPRRDPEAGRPRTGWLAPEYRSLVVALAVYALTMINLPFGYDGNTAFDLGPFVAGHPLRPLFMLVRPFATLLLWQIVGMLFYARLGVTAYTALQGEAPASARIAPSLRRLATLLTCLMAAVLLVEALLALLLNLAPTATASLG